MVTVCACGGVFMASFARWLSINLFMVPYWVQFDPKPEKRDTSESTKKTITSATYGCQNLTDGSRYLTAKHRRGHFDLGTPTGD